MTAEKRKKVSVAIGGRIIYLRSVIGARRVIPRSYMFERQTAPTSNDTRHWRFFHDHPISPVERVGVWIGRSLELRRSIIKIASLGPWNGSPDNTVLETINASIGSVRHEIMRSRDSANCGPTVMQKHQWDWVIARLRSQRDPGLDWQAPKELQSTKWPETHSILIWQGAQYSLGLVTVQTCPISDIPEAFHLLRPSDTYWETRVALPQGKRRALNGYYRLSGRQRLLTAPHGALTTPSSLLSWTQQFNDLTTVDDKPLLATPRYPCDRNNLYIPCRPRTYLLLKKSRRKRI